MRSAPPVYVPPPPALFTWTGFYVGANAGYGFGARGFGGPGSLSVPAAPVGTFAVTPAGGGSFLGAGGHRDGFVGGGQFGYNLQIPSGFLGTNGGVVLGFETDFDYSGVGASRIGGGGIGLANAGGNPRVGPAGNGFGIAPVGTGLATSNGNVAFFNGGRRGPGDFLGTVRGRLGYAFDRMLIYATGGLAYSTGRDGGVGGGFANGASVPGNFYVGNAAQTAGAGVGPSYGGRDSVVYGYTVGGGVEYALPTGSVFNFLHSSAVTIKVEGLYFDLGRNGISGRQVVGVSNEGAPITAANIVSRNNDFAVVRAGVNYKF